MYSYMLLFPINDSIHYIGRTSATCSVDTPKPITQLEETEPSMFMREYM